ncbi:hypothetical protein [Pseudomonas sp. JV241A]|uniref:hypothetical protein n=1 Tax=Pseudomonas sp. JV241A TaxID=2078785 RepID=UPI0010651227|nr:hypothetical protein [Pseudomonas sp. JV241A]
MVSFVAVCQNRSLNWQRLAETRALKEPLQWLEGGGSMIGKRTTGNQEILKILMLRIVNPPVLGLGRIFIGKVIEKNGKSLPECAGCSPFTSVLP